MIKRFAVIGNPIEHSLSPVIHHHFAQQTHINLTYEKIRGEDPFFEKQAADFFSLGGQGMNVTLPYKQRAFAMAIVHTQRCEIAGAANTLWMSENHLHADNTDGIGLIRDLARYIKVADKRILILGSGGAARGIIYPLLEAKPEKLTIANRTLEKAKKLQLEFPQLTATDLDNIVGAFDLVINATSASLTGSSLSLPSSLMEQKPICYDLAYKHKEDTPFVQYAKTFGCTAVDGLGMLVEQAAEAFFIWNGVLPLTSSVLESLRR